VLSSHTWLSGNNTDMVYCGLWPGHSCVAEFWGMGSGDSPLASKATGAESLDGAGVSQVHSKVGTDVMNLIEFLWAVQISSLCWGLTLLVPHCGSHGGGPGIGLQDKPQIPFLPCSQQTSPPESGGGVARQSATLPAVPGTPSVGVGPGEGMGIGVGVCPALCFIKVGLVLICPFQLLSFLCDENIQNPFF
jgi:hypothetical protein